MRNRPDIYDLVLVVLIALVVFRSAPLWVANAHAAKWKLVEGETYIVVVDCLPAFTAPPGANPCYVERLTVKDIIDEDTVLFLDPEDPLHVWQVNMRRVYAVTPDPPKERRAAGVTYDTVVIDSAGKITLVP